MEQSRRFRYIVAREPSRVRADDDDDDDVQWFNVHLKADWKPA